MLMLLLACAPATVGGADDSLCPCESGQPAEDSGPIGSEGGGVGDGATEAQRFEVTCSGRSSYSETIDIGAEPGEWPPDFVIWTHWNEEYAAYYEALGGEFSTVWNLSSGNGGFDANGDLAVGCTYFVVEDFEGYLYDKIVVLVE